MQIIGDDECMFGHEEAYVNLVSYTLMMSKEHVCRQIQVVSDDTDVFVLLVHFYWKLRRFAAIKMKQFDGKTIDINETTMTLADKCVQLLPIYAYYHRLRQCGVFGASTYGLYNALLFTENGKVPRGY